MPLQVGKECDGQDINKTGASDICNIKQRAKTYRIAVAERHAKSLTRQPPVWMLGYMTDP